MANGTNSIGIGNGGAEATGNTAIAIGYSANVASGGTDSIAIGNAADIGAATTSSIAIGGGALVGAAASNSVVIGENAAVGAGMSQSVVIGMGASAAADVSGGERIVIGKDATANYWRGVAIGYKALAGAVSSTAIGRGAQALGTHGIAIGRGAYSMVANRIVLGFSGGNNACDVYFDNGDQSKFTDPTDIAAIDRTPTSCPVIIHGMSGKDNSAAPSNNRAGGDVKIAAGQGTGTAASGKVILQLSPAGGSSNNTENALTDGFSLLSNGDIEVHTLSAGVILKSPDGTRYRATIANGGTWSISAA